MKVLVAAASRHGSTMELAQAVGTQLARTGLQAEVRRVEDVDHLEGYDAVVLGSALYVGRWLPAAVEFVRLHEAGLRRLPVWTFSSGPLGAPEALPKGEPEEPRKVADSIGAREHRVFGGSLGRDGLGLGERTIVKVVKAPYGDFRDWDELRAWATDIAGALTGGTGAQPAAAAGARPRFGPSA
ncbi:MAG TPA: flavodoxin domain-containing protein [Candidatus Limnocylindria bacterium]|nr:flavodoxin domain-containing protein [Candidatus Limnocylindria bacterium]